MTQIKLSFCMIAKNEEKFIGRCLESVKDLVDEMIVVDTGSTDRTVQIAEGYGACVYHHEWKNDFSEAKNFSIQFAEGEWILMLDADEELEPKDISVVRKLIRIKQCDAFSFIFLCDGPDNAVYRHRTVRLFRNHHVHFEDIIHERSVINGNICLSPVRVYHHGYNLDPEILKKKTKRNENLLLKQVDMEPSNSYAWANLIRNYRIQKDFEKITTMSEKALSIPGIPLFNKQLIMNDLLYGYFITNQLKNAVEIGLIGLKDNPAHMDMWFVLGGIMIKLREFEKAISYFKQYLKIRESDEEHPGLEGLLIDTYGYQGRAWNNIGSCYLDLVREDEAVGAYQTAIRFEDTNVIFYKNLAGLFMRMGLISDAVRELEKAINLGIADDAVIRSLEELRSQ